MIPKDGDLFQISFVDKEEKVIFEGQVLGKEEETPIKTFRIYAFVYDPHVVTKTLVEKYGVLTIKYSKIPYTELYICSTCNASYSSKECLEEHESEH